MVVLTRNDQRLLRNTFGKEWAEKFRHESDEFLGYEGVLEVLFMLRDQLERNEVRSLYIAVNVHGRRPPLEIHTYGNQVFRVSNAA